MFFCVDPKKFVNHFEPACPIRMGRAARVEKRQKGNLVLTSQVGFGYRWLREGKYRDTGVETLHMHHKKTITHPPRSIHCRLNTSSSSPTFKYTHTKRGVWLDLFTYDNRRREGKRTRQRKRERLGRRERETEHVCFPLCRFCCSVCVSSF